MLWCLTCLGTQIQKYTNHIVTLDRLNGIQTRKPVRYEKIEAPPTELKLNEFHFTKNMFFFQNTPLHLATMENKPNAIALLLTMGCRLIYNNMDMSAIDYAIYYKFPDAALAMVTHEER